MTADPVDACRMADVLVVLTEWDDFRLQDPEVVVEVMARPALVDARNVLDRARWESQGFHHQGIGR